MTDGQDLFFLCPENSFGRFIQRCKKLRIYELLWISRFAMSKLTSETQKCKNLCVFTVTPASVLACLNPWAASPSNRSFTKHIVELTESVDVFSNKTGLGGTVLGTHHRTMVNRGHWPSESNNSAQVLKTFNSQWIVLNYEVLRRAQYSWNSLAWEPSFAEANIFLHVSLNSVARLKGYLPMGSYATSAQMQESCPSLRVAKQITAMPQEQM